MSLKKRRKNRILWFFVCLIGALAMAYIVVPPMISLNYLRPSIEKNILENTGIPTKINGNIRIGLLGTATIVIHDTDTPFGNIPSMTLSVPLRQIFKISKSDLSGTIDIYNANLKIDSVFQPQFNQDVNLYNTNVWFLDRNYHIVRAYMSNNIFNGKIRTKQHKYDISYSGGEFTVKNNTNNLHISGLLFSNGTAAGHLDIHTNNVNRWFEFDDPKINEPVNIGMNFTWDGGFGFEFSDIIANNILGNITLSPDGYRTINLSAQDLKYNMSFLLKPNNLFHKTHFNLDFYGDLLLGKHTFKHLFIDAGDINNQIQINRIIADNLSLTGGTIDATGGHNINLQITGKQGTTDCLFSGTPTQWECTKFSYQDIVGTLSVKDQEFKANISSPNKMPPIESIIAAIKPVGTRGIIEFTFADKGGFLTITKDKVVPTFAFSANTTLQDLDLSFGFLPPFMATSIGNLTSDHGVLTFVPNDKTWSISVSKDTFHITGENFKKWLSNNQNLNFISDIPYVISGKYKKGFASNLNFLLGDQIFTGSSNQDTLTIESDEINLDKFINSDYFDNFESNSFINQHPIMQLFDLPFNISLHSDKIIYQGTEYNNFVYSLKRNNQTFSISDSNRGNFLATITKKQNEYDIALQLNKFVFDGSVLAFESPLNIYNTSVTGTTILHTYGKIANDIIYNLSGTFDLTFTGGEFIGFGFDEFYASANNIATMNSEFMIANALDSGITALKTMHIIGKYDNGNIETTQPLTLKLRHTDISGNLKLINDKIIASFNIIMRGTSPTPKPFQLYVYPDNSRKYSLSEIMRNFDSSFMKTFIQTHNQF